MESIYLTVGDEIKMVLAPKGDANPIRYVFTILRPWIQLMTGQGGGRGDDARL